MLDMIRKLLFTSVGFAVLTEEKIKEMVSELEKQGQVSTEEGRRLAEDLINKARQQTRDLNKAVEEQINRMVEKSQLVSRHEYEELKNRVEQLEIRCQTGSTSGAEPSGEEGI